MVLDKTPSEFGGAPGLIQPNPHSVNDIASEGAMLERAVDPADETDSPAGVLSRILDGSYGAVVPKEEVIVPLVPEVLVAGNDWIDDNARVVVVGNSDLRTARIKASASPQMTDAIYGPEVENEIGPAPIVELLIGSVSVGWFYQILMNGIYVNEVGVFNA